MSQKAPPKYICMADIESLDLGPRAVVTQIGMVFCPADDPETELKSVLIHLPIDPQLSLKRTVSAGTLVWWMTDPSITPQAREEFKLSLGNDFDELPSLIRSMIRKFEAVVGGEQVEVWAKGPQFDITNLDSLCRDVALESPWPYGQVRDLRTLMALAGLSSRDFVRDTVKYPEHMAVSDCRYQLTLMVEAQKQLRARS